MNLFKRSSLAHKSLALFCILASLYLLTYTGIPVAQDELALFSITESLIRYGDTYMYSTFNYYPGVGIPPWGTSIYEPGQIILAAPLYWIAYHAPIGGIQQTVWLFNIVVIAGIGVLIYHVGLRLKFSDQASLITALVVGSATALWPYSQTYFREPLFAFWIIFAAYWLLTWRESKAFFALLGTLIGILGMLLTKEVGFLGLPSILLLALPNKIKPRTIAIYMACLIGLIALTQILAPLLLSSNIRFQSSVYTGRAEHSSISYLFTVFKAYFFSPGYSIWASSPILLMGLIGGWQFYRQGQWQIPFASCLLLVMLALGYGLGGREWHGGRGWGARYLLVAVPMLGLLLLPVVEWLLNHRKWIILISPLLIFSWAIQLAGLLVPLQTFYSILEQRFPGKTPQVYFEEGAWQFSNTQWYIHLQHLSLKATPLALSYADHSGVIIGLIALILVTGLAILSLGERQSSLRRLSPLLLVLFLGTAGYLIYNLRHDPRLLADRAELHQLVETLRQRSAPNDIVLLSDPEYGPFFMNYYRGQAIYVVLPYSPGERESSAAPEPDFHDGDGDGLSGYNERITTPTRYALDYTLSGRFKYLWLVTNRRPIDTWAYRPVENFLAFNAYPIAEVNYTAQNLSRLIQFGAQQTNAYPRYITPREPYQFGQYLRLIAYDFPLGSVTGDYLPISLVWQVTGFIESDYHINVLLLNAEGIPVAQQGGIPQATFGYMPQWNDPVYQTISYLQIDQHGLALPPDLPSGSYSLQVVVYDWRDGSRPMVSFQGQEQPSGAAVLGQVTVVAPYKGE